MPRRHRKRSSGQSRRYRGGDGDGSLGAIKVMNLFETLAAMIRRDGRAALVTLVEVKGSSPRDAGARMAVRADGAFSGTVGGGALEWQALAEAQAMLASPE